MRVTVLGASGTIGGALLPRLAGHHEVTAVSRHPRESADGVRWVVGDVENPTSLRSALDGAELVYYLVHNLGNADFAARDRRAASITATAAEHAGVEQIVYLGGLGDDTDADLSEHLRSRRETERVLASGATPVTTIRAAVVVAPGSAAFETIVGLVDRLPAMVCPRWVGTPTQPIAVDDVVTYLDAVGGMDEAIGQTFEAGGPQVMTYRDMIEQIAQIRHKRPLIVEVPVLTPRLSSLWLQLVTPVNAATAKPLVDGLRNPTVVKDDRLRELVPMELTPFSAAAGAALAGRR